MPDEKVPCRMPTVKGDYELARLIASPNVPALKLWEPELPLIDIGDEIVDRWHRSGTLLESGDSTRSADQPPC